MEYKELPGTSIKISPITFGAFAIGGWFWGGANKADAVKTIETAINNGITTIDTAPIYGMGHSENIVGEAIKGKRDKVQILTKFGMTWEGTNGDFIFDTEDNDGNSIQVYKYNGKQSIIEECEKSLKRLQTDYIDLYQMHWPDSTTPIEETMEAVEILLQQGKILSAGVCNCPVDLLKDAGKVTRLSTNQVAYSMINRDIEKDLVPYCLDNGIGILPHTTLQKGLLTGKLKPGHQFNMGDNRPNTPFFKDGNHEKVMKMLDTLMPIANENNVTLAQLAINWTMQQPAIVSVLVGARNSEQMLDNITALNFTLSTEELEIINSEFSKLELKL